MTDSNSDSDCFESADEEFNDENISKDDNVKSSPNKNDSGSTELFSPTGDDLHPVHSDACEESNPSKSAIQFRKRPEKRKNLPKTLDATINRKPLLSNQIFRSDIIKPDVLIQDITTNISKNINKGFNTIQQTSNSIKDLVISSLPASGLKEDSSRFSYDDDDEDEDDEGEEKELASHLPEYEDDSVPDKLNKEILNQSENSDNCVKLQEVLKPFPQDSVGETLPVVTCLEEFDYKICSDLNQVSEIKNVGYATEKAIGNISDVNIEKFENFKNPDTAENFCTAIKKEADQYLSESSEKIKTQQNLEVENDIVDNIETKDLKHFIKEKDNDSFKLKSAYAEEDNKEYSVSNNDGWDTSELDLEGLELEESSETDLVQDNAEEKDNLIRIENMDASLENQISSCNEGWDDFDFDDDDLNNVKTENKKEPLEKYDVNEIMTAEVGSNYFKCEGVNEKENVRSNNNNSKWSGWDNFGEKQETKQKSGWTLSNWGVNALLNTATSVTHGLSTVFEAGLGVPDPETLAKMEMKANADSNNFGQQKETLPPAKSEESITSSLKLFPDFGITGLVAGVTKNIVEHPKVQEIGSKVISGGLDTLESFGKKTMEVLQEGDPGLKRKRALLLGTDKPILSQVLREAKAKAEMENKRMEEKQLSKLCHFETLFDDYQGLIHLEALEMLSRQCELKLEQLKSSLSAKEFEDMIDILDEVKELCIIDEDEFKLNYSGMVDFKISLTKATASLQNEISVKKIIQIYEEFNMWLKSEENCVKSSQSLCQRAMSVLAELTAATVQQFHKGGELLSVKERRKTVEEADALLQMTGIVCCEINKISEMFLKLHTSRVSENDMIIEKKIKEESANATSYIKDAFNLLIPVLQLGAAT